MKTFLKVLVILLFLVSIAALSGGVLLFMKRELLKGAVPKTAGEKKWLLNRKKLESKTKKPDAGVKEEAEDAAKEEE